LLAGIFSSIWTWILRKNFLDKIEYDLTIPVYVFVFVLFYLIFYLSLKKISISSVPTELSHLPVSSEIKEHVEAIINVLKKQIKTNGKQTLVKLIYQGVATELNVMKATGRHSDLKERELIKWAEKTIKQISSS
jgi:hypothetical protein